MLSVLLKLRLDGERVRGDLRYDEEDSDLDLPDKRVDSHGRKGESSLLFIRPRVDSPRLSERSQVSVCVFWRSASLGFICSGSESDL